MLYTRNFPSFFHPFSKLKKKKKFKILKNSMNWLMVKLKWLTSRFLSFSFPFFYYYYRLRSAAIRKIYKKDGIKLFAYSIEKGEEKGKKGGSVVFFLLLELYDYDDGRYQTTVHHSNLCIGHVLSYLQCALPWIRIPTDRC